MTAATMPGTSLFSLPRRPRVLRVTNVLSSFKPVKGSSTSNGWIDRVTNTCAKGMVSHSVGSSEKDGGDGRKDSNRVINRCPDTLMKIIYFDNKENIDPVHIKILLGPFIFDNHIKSFAGNGKRQQCVPSRLYQ
jgi:hypothetical protein